MNTSIRFFHPFNFLGYSKPKDKFDPSDDVYRYGFCLDLTTEMYFYTYDWGYGINFRLFGFGFELSRYGF